MFVFKTEAQLQNLMFSRREPFQGIGEGSGKTRLEQALICIREERLLHEISQLRITLIVNWVVERD